MSTIKSFPLLRPTIGKPLWYAEEGVQHIGFLMGEFVSEETGKSYLIGLITEGRVEVVSPDHCWAADWCEVRGVDLRKIICANPTWGVGQIIEQPNQRGRWQEIIVALPKKVSDGRSIQVRTTVQEVTLIYIGSR